MPLFSLLVPLVAVHLLAEVDESVVIPYFASVSKLIFGFLGTDLEFFLAVRGFLGLSEVLAGSDWALRHICD